MSDGRESMNKKDWKRNEIIEKKRVNKKTEGKVNCHEYEYEGGDFITIIVIMNCFNLYFICYFYYLYYFNHFNYFNYFCYFSL